MRDNPDNAPEKKAEYKAKLEAMSDHDLFKETKDKIWLSAYAGNNPRSCYHWQCDATWAEWSRRNNGNTEQYAEAHRQVMRAEGYSA